MRVRLDGVERTGRGVTVDVDPAVALRAVRDPADERVLAPAPGPVHDQVGIVSPRSSTSRRSLLAAVARSLGHRSTQREAVADLRDRLDEMSVDAHAETLRAARRRVAQTGTDVERLRERVATLQGRVQTLSERGVDASDATTALREAARDLSEAETDRHAATQALSRAEERARAARDARQERFGLEDRLANLEREARRELAASVRPAVEAAVVAVPRSQALTVESASRVTLGLAGARVASVEAPVVLACRRFPDARAAARWLDAPVLRVRPAGPPPRGGRGRSSGA